MRDVLVDSSIWISFFKGAKGEEQIAAALDYLLAGDEAVINEAIKSEVLPAMAVRNEDVTAIEAIRLSPMNIDWTAVRELQIKCLKHGINKVGLIDLIIARQAIDLDLPLFTLDKHFSLIAKIEPELKLWPSCLKNTKDGEW